MKTIHIALLILFFFCQFWQSHAQSYVKQFSSIGSNQKSVARVIKMENDHYLLIRAVHSHMPSFPLNFNRLQFIEYDFCGIVASHEIEFEDFHRIRQMEKIILEEDSIRIPVWVDPGHTRFYDEAGVISVSKKTFQGRYQYLDLQQEYVVQSFTTFLDDDYLLTGRLIKVGQPEWTWTVVLDKSLKVIKQLNLATAIYSSGNALVANDGVYVFDGNRMHFLNHSFEKQWSKSLFNSNRIQKAISVEDGIVLAVEQHGNGIKNVFFMKVDFSGNLLWQTYVLAYTNPGTYEAERFYKNLDGSFSFLSEYWDGYSTNLMITKIDGLTGALLNQRSTNNINNWERLQFQDYKSEPNVEVICMLNSEEEHVILRLDNNFPSCDLSPVQFVEEAPASPFFEWSSPEYDDIISHSYDMDISLVPSTVESNTNCTSEPPSYDLLPDEASICGEQKAEYYINEIPFSITWSDGSYERHREFTEPGTYAYSYEICDEYYGEEIEIKNDSCPCDLFIPNVFSPDSGTENSQFQIYHSCQAMDNFSILIYNRWGGLMFASEDPAFVWDGTWKGKTLQSGVYTYLMNYEDAELPGQKQTKQGAIVLLR